MIKKLKKHYYNFKQKGINKQYMKEGLTDNVLDKQISLNVKRHESDIHDSTEVLSVDDSGQEFVQ